MTVGGLDLSEGPVTIMFTDIVGSTSLRTTLGDTQADALFRKHDDLVLEQITEHRGQDQRAALGDGFLAVFASTRRAIAAAVGIQRSMDAFNRSRSGAPIAVRIGLNTGEVAWQDGQLSGEAVHAASRVCAAADPGQILCSDVTRQLAGTIPDLSFRDAGEYDLKGFPQPWRLWDIVWVRESAPVADEVFVGREAELGTLRTRLVSALDGHGSLVLVGGEPGVGKTTLVRQLIREAEGRGALALFGRCYEFEGAMPYSPFVEMLEQALAVMPPDLVREDMGEDAAEVARMVPALRRQFPDIPEPTDLPPEQQRRYFFNAVSSFIGRAAARFPLLLVIDDVHWADVPTLLLIEHVGEVLSDMRVLGVGTYRDVELDVSRPLAATLDRMVRARTVERLPIKRFDLDGVAGLVEALVGRTPPPGIAAAIYEETEGNPFFVVEVFRHLVEEGKIFDSTGAFRTDVALDELDVPESVRLVVGRRLERLGPDALKALAAGAVVGRGFPFAFLEELTDVPSGRLIDVVEEAEAAMVIVPEERGGEIYYTFAHELIRQTLLSSVSLLRRQRLHLAVADVIERLDKEARTTRPSEVAHHLLQAGASADPDRTLEFLELAVDRAMESAAFEEALRSTDDALTVVGDDRPELKVRLKHRLGAAQRAVGKFESSLATWAEVVDEYVALGDVETAANLCWEMGYELVWLNRFPEAYATYARGLEILGDHNAAIRAPLMGSLGLLTGFGGLYAPGIEQLDEAERIAEVFGDNLAIGRVNWARSLVEWSFARMEAAARTGHRAIECLRACGDLWTLVDALAWTSYPLGSMHEHAEAEALALEGLDIAQRVGHYGGEMLARRGITLTRAPRTADLDELEEAIAKDLELCLAIESPWVSQSYAWKAYLDTFRGRLDEGLAHAEEAIRLEPTSAWSGVGWAIRLLNRTYADEVDEVRAAIADSLESLRAVGDESGIGPLIQLSVATECAAVFGFDDVAGELYPNVVAMHARLWGRPFDWALTHRVAGMAAARLGNWDHAEEHFTAALHEAETNPNRLDEPHVRLWYGEMLLRRGGTGDADRGRRLVSEAGEALTRLGLPVRAETAKRLLANS